MARAGTCWSVQRWCFDAGAGFLMLSQWWDKLVAGFVPGAPVAVSGWVLFLVLAAVALASVPRGSWRFFGLFVTVVHELGHAFAALMTGRVIKGLHFRFDHSGTTYSAGRGKLGQAWSGFWGYPAPAVVGATLIWAALQGYAGATLSVSSVLLLLTLLFVRNLQGVVIAVGCAAVAVALVWFADPLTTGWVTLGLGMALLVGAVRDWFNVLSVHTRRRRELSSSDAYILSRFTHVPAALWLSGFAAVIAGSLVFAVAQIAAAG